MRIFDRFKRGSGDATHNHEGLGLGLAMCRDNAALMGGSLNVESTYGIGSEFTLVFPAERAENTRPAPFAGRTGIVIGFSSALRTQICAHLSSLGFVMETADEAYVGLGVAERIAARRSVLDLVMVDSDLYSMDSIGLCRRLRARDFAQRSTIIWVAQSADSVLPPDDLVDDVVSAKGGVAEISRSVSKLISEQTAIELVQAGTPGPAARRVLVVEDNEINQNS